VGGAIERGRDRGVAHPHVDQKGPVNCHAWRRRCRGETLTTLKQESILFLWHWKQAMRRQQYRQAPARPAPKPVAPDADTFEPCPFCGGDGAIPVWDVLAECAVCRGTGQRLT